MSPRNAIPTTPLRVAIVIPTLDEEAALSISLPRALALSREVVVSDGGSRDGTVELARRLGAVVVCGPPGRGEQLNRGAAASDAPALLFLHADTQLPTNAVDEIRRVLAAGAPGGGFRIAFDPAPWKMRLATRLINARTVLTATPLGDQSQFSTRQAFDTVGGFRSWPILEDLDFARRLRRLGKLAILDGPSTTGSRRFLARGVIRTVSTNWFIWALFFCGFPPARLARLYSKIR